MGKHNFSYYGAILIAVIAILMFIVYINKKNKQAQKTVDAYIPTKDNYSHIESFVEGLDDESGVYEKIEDVVDNFQLLDIEPNQNNPEMSVLFGKGPGIYGSGRNYSEGIFIKDPNLEPYN